MLSGFFSSFVSFVFASSVVVNRVNVFYFVLFVSVLFILLVFCENNFSFLFDCLIVLMLFCVVDGDASACLSVVVRFSSLFVMVFSVFLFSVLIVGLRCLLYVVSVLCMLCVFVVCVCCKLLCWFAGRVFMIVFSRNFVSVVSVFVDVEYLSVDVGVLRMVSVCVWRVLLRVV